MRIKSLRSEQLTLLAALFFVFACNSVFWTRLLAVLQPHRAGDWLFVGVFALVLLLLFNLALTLLAMPYVLRPALTLLLLITPVVVYFMDAYGVMINVDMLRNAAQTDPAETRDLLTLKMGLYWLLLGGVPLFALWRTPLVYRSLKKEALLKMGIVGGSAVLIAMLSFSFYKDFASVFRNYRELRFILAPTNYLQAASKFIQHSANLKPIKAEPIATDAHRLISAKQVSEENKKPTLTFIVVGETARAANFSLNGYARKTNPLLEQQAGLIYFKQMQSCGTDTAVSVPCMFSKFGRNDYSHSIALHHQGLLDVLQQVGYKVLWRDNQSGCKGACDRLPTENTANLKDPALCKSGECWDEILLQGLQDKIDHLTQDTVIVLHMMGSHGPAYYKRYPPAFEVFKPVCKTSQLDLCTRDEIVNAYDNSLRYTDYVLSSLIDVLRSNSTKVDSSMTYISDHGESLGENGMYLHGTPYMLAPDEQTHVPAMMWLSDGYAQQAKVDLNCLKKQATVKHSHDDLFHSTLSQLKIQTKEYRADRDWFAACRSSGAGL